MEFIDKQCIVFDNEEENKFEYTTIHGEFCDMVNSLLEGFLSEMGISPEEFVKVCQNENAAALNEFVFNQILAVDDFLSFKKMMLKRNLELNVQAMSMMAVRRTHLPACPRNTRPLTPRRAAQMDEKAQAGAPATPEQPGLSLEAPEEEEEEVDEDMDPELAEAIRLSKETFNAPLTPSRAAAAEERAAPTAEEDEELKRALAMSMGDTGVVEARAAQEDAELKHAIALSQALEEQRLLALREEQERQQAAAAAASQAEAAAKQRAEEARAKAAADAAAAAAEQEAVRQQQAAAAAREAAEAKEREAAAARASAEAAVSSKREASLSSLGAAPPLGGRLPALAPMSDETRIKAAEATVARRETVKPKPAPAPAAVAPMQLSEAEMEARRQHLLAQRAKIMEKNTATRVQKMEEAAAVRKSEAARAPSPPPMVEEPEPEPEPLASASTSIVRRSLSRPKLTRGVWLAQSRRVRLWCSQRRATPRRSGSHKRFAPPPPILPLPACSSCACSSSRFSLTVRCLLGPQLAAQMRRDLLSGLK